MLAAKDRFDILSKTRFNQAGTKFGCGTEKTSLVLALRQREKRKKKKERKKLRKAGAKIDLFFRMGRVVAEWLMWTTEEGGSIRNM